MGALRFSGRIPGFGEHRCPCPTSRPIAATVAIRPVCHFDAVRRVCILAAEKPGYRAAPDFAIESGLDGFVSEDGDLNCPTPGTPGRAARERTARSGCRGASRQSNVVSMATRALLQSGVALPERRGERGSRRSMPRSQPHHARRGAGRADRRARHTVALHDAHAAMVAYRSTIGRSAVAVVPWFRRVVVGEPRLRIRPHRLPRARGAHRRLSLLRAWRTSSRGQRRRRAAPHAHDVPIGHSRRERPSIAPRRHGSRSPRRCPWKSSSTGSRSARAGTAG